METQGAHTGKIDKSLKGAAAGKPPPFFRKIRAVEPFRAGRLMGTGHDPARAGPEEEQGLIGG